MTMIVIRKQTNHGFAGLLSVIGFMMISLSALTAFSYHYRQSQLIVMQELQARQAFLFAESALLWGSTLYWDLSSRQLNKWQCQAFSADPKIKSCLFLISHSMALLQGQSESVKGYKRLHYQWIEILKEHKKSLRMIPNGWLDYCPLSHKECAW